MRAQQNLPDLCATQPLCACGCGQPAVKRYAIGHRRNSPNRIWDKSIVLLSPEDEDLRALRWTIRYDGYVVSSGPIHRVIGERMHGGPIPRGYQVDHINENKMDNRRENLRVVTLSENRQNNTKPHAYKKSGLPRGVYPGQNSDRSNFQVIVTRKRNGVKRPVYLGTYDKLEDAVAAYDRYKREQTAYVPVEQRP